jgi:quercetin dioxygenase-like cupin family protein
MNAHTLSTFTVGTTVHLLGTLVTLRANGSETGGAFSLVEIAVAPGQGTPPHRHDDAEAFYVLEGTMSFVLGGQPITRNAGEFVHIPSQEPHAFRNETSAVARMLGFNLPGGPHVAFFAEVGEHVIDGLSFPPLSPPDVPRLVEAGLRHGITILPPG